MKMPFSTAWTLLAMVSVGPAVAGHPAYEELRAMAPDGRRAAIEGFTLARDVHTFVFESGTLHLLDEVDGRTVGAVFLGRGRYELNPATEDERHHLQTIRNDRELQRLVNRFDSLLILATDDSIETLLGAAARRDDDRPDVRAAERLARYRKQQRKDYHTNFDLRLLQDLLADEPIAPGVFMAFMDGEDIPPAVAAVDPLGFEALRIGGDLGAEEVGLFVEHDVKGGYWYLSHRADELESGAYRECRPRLLADARHYEVYTEIGRDSDIEQGETKLHLTPLIEGQRVLPLTLMRRLRIESATFGPGEVPVELDFIQEDENEDPDAAVVFPRPLEPDEEVEVTIRYAGSRVIADFGADVYAVARSGWYPSIGTFRDRATFDLSFRAPAKNHVIAVGELVDRKVEGRTALTRWRAGFPMMVAGFNYGELIKKEQTDEVSGITIEVYSTKGAVLEQNAMADGLNSVKLFTTAFGELPYRRIALGQTPAWFGQAWPTLVFMPHASFADGSLMAQIGPAGVDFRDTVGSHEMAHQWWGHLLGWESYRDQWLSEAFANFSSAYLVQVAEGWERHDKIMATRLEGVEEFYKEERHRVGPISRGWRLSSFRTRGGYNRVVYDKGGHVLHMLRMMMRDERAEDPDRRFFDMMRDFVATFRNKNPSTWDFQQTVQKHMIGELDAAGDGTIDWFFDQWVYGTAIPTIEFDATVTAAGQGRFRIQGKLSQSDVPDGFKTLVPIYADLGKGRVGLIGRMPMSGAMSRDLDATLNLPARPKRVAANLRHDVLCFESKNRKGKQ